MMQVIILCAIVCAAAVPAHAAVSIGGLVAPTSFTLDPQGRVYISEKGGTIKLATSLAASTADPVLTIQNNMSTIGFTGLTSVLYKGGYLYATYQILGPSTTNACTDFGNPAGRQPDSVVGCPTYGRLSRFPVTPDTGALGDEEVLLGSYNKSCVQFAIGGIAQVMHADATGASEDVLISVGVGSNGNAVDYGQWGDDPCSTGSALGGAFRSQDDASLDGKFIRFTPSTGAWSIIARGTSDPWRSAWVDGSLMFVDPGMGNVDEINGPLQAGDNYGMPCMDGDAPNPAYAALNTTLCSTLYAANATKVPWYTLEHPAGGSTALSALGWDPTTGRVLFGDYVNGFMYSISQSADDVVLEAQGVAPVYMQWVDGYGLLYVDVAAGKVADAPTMEPAAGAHAAGLGAAAAAAAVCAGLAVLVAGAAAE